MTTEHGRQTSVLILGGSIRARVQNQAILLDMAHKSDDLAAYRRRVVDFLKAGGVLSNSEIIAGAAMVGARSQGAVVDYFPLVELFPAKDRRVFDLKANGTDRELTMLDSLGIAPQPFQRLLGLLDRARGVVLATPVYFGDRSSVANKLLQICTVQRLLTDKAFGMVSVGAKRNGGQETTNIFGLFEAVTQGALAVGNGPPTSQYGGTAVGGSVGCVVEDAWGLETALGTGSRVAQVAGLMAAGDQQAPQGDTRITILVTIDDKRKSLRAYLDGLIAQIRQRQPWAQFTVIDLIDHDIYRCLGCETCPRNKGVPGLRAHCVIKDPTDCMEMVREHLGNSDGAILAGLNILEVESVIFRYQVSTERMRFIRRNDFELTNLLMTGLCYHQFGATVNPFHSLKTMVSYLRHNTIIHRPVEVFEHQGHLLDTGVEMLERFCQTARRLREGRASLKAQPVEYDPFAKASGYRKQAPWAAGDLN